jgi:Flp pilus assembly protein TadD, contains TPR repeats
MISVNRLLQSAFLFLLFAAAVIAVQAQNNSSIHGNVFDAQTRRAVPDLYVELLNDMGFTLRRMRIDTTGRFSFTGLRAGRYKIKVITIGTNYLEETKEVTLVSFPRRGGWTPDIAYVDFFLKLDPRRVNIGSGGPASSVFVQEVPGEARKLYKKGVDQLEDKKDIGIETLKKALEIFPDYFDALNRLGMEYFERKQFAEAVPYLVKATNINRRSFSSFFLLGLASYNLRDLNTAGEAMREATVINPQSIDAQLWYGIVMRITSDFEKAEKALLQAKSLAENAKPVSEIHWQLALLYEKNARYKEAADELEEYLKIETKAPNAAQIRKLIEQLRAKAK